MNSTSIASSPSVLRQAGISLGLLAAFVLAGRFIPAKPIDPWGLFNWQKIAQMVIAIALIQMIGVVLASRFGRRAGAIVTGFLGGVISSTAMTATLAKRSRDRAVGEPGTDALLYYCATSAMLIEAGVLVYLGSVEAFTQIFWIFLGPLLLTAARIFQVARRFRTGRDNSEEEAQGVSWISVLKLSVFIVAILGLSKLGQIFFGEYGLLLLTFLVSLFEIHGSIIANVQLLTNGHLSEKLLGGLVAVSVGASYVSKLFIVSTIGGAELRREIRIWTAVMSATLLGSWLLFRLAY